MMEVAAEEMVSDILGCMEAALTAAQRPVCCYQWMRRSKTSMPTGCDGGHGEAQGVAWVRIDERLFEDEKKSPKGFGGAPCTPSTVEIWEMEAGIARCALGDFDGLTCEEETKMAISGAHDDQLLRMAIICCDRLKKYRITPKDIRTLGPDGGCIASVMRFTAKPV